MHSSLKLILCPLFRKMVIFNGCCLWQSTISIRLKVFSYAIIRAKYQFNHILLCFFFGKSLLCGYRIRCLFEYQTWLIVIKNILVKILWHLQTKWNWRYGCYLVYIFRTFMNYVAFQTLPPLELQDTNLVKLSYLNTQFLKKLQKLINSSGLCARRITNCNTRQTKSRTNSIVQLLL